MSVTRDFESRDRSATMESTLSAPRTSMGASRSPVGLARSPTSPRSPTVGRRRGSTLSASSPNDLRMRHPSRTNTVTTYHEPEPNVPVSMPGAEPGIDTAASETNIPPHISSVKADCEISIIDFSNDIEVENRHIHATNDTLERHLQEPRPDEYACRWISVNGLSFDVIKLISNTYNLHRLAIEDIILTHSRTKVDWYADHACVILTLQKLVRLHSHHGRDDKCDCMDPVERDSEEDEKAGIGPVTTQKEKNSWWAFWKSKPKRKSPLPYHLDKDDDGRIDEFVHAHSGISYDSPIRPVRTLHRYENSQIPEHTAFMEKHSTLAGEDLAVSVEQVSIFLTADNTVISFFEQSAEDVESPLRERIHSAETMLRISCDGSLLLQAIIDTIVDLAIPVKEAYNKARKELQVDAMVNPNIRTSRALHIFGEEIDMLQNLIKPIVHLVNALRDHNAEPVAPPAPPPPAPTPNTPTIIADDRPSPLQGKINKRDREGAPSYNRKLSEYRRAGPLKREGATSVSITPLAHTYLGDVLDHCITLIQALEQMDASAANISTLIFNTVGARTNNFMMILAVVTVFFSPLTFISGYFGQNFDSGAGLPHTFGFFWTVSMPVLVVFMGLVFGFMLWDNIRDWLSKAGIRAHRHKRNKARRERFH